MFTRRQIAVGALVLSAAAPLTAPRLFAQKDEEAAVAAAVEALRQAMIAADRNKLEALVADQLSYGHSTGAIETKQEFIDNVVGKKSVYKSIKQTDQTITLAGDAAIVRHVFDGEVETGGRTIMPKINVLQVWQRQASWKLLARQAFPRAA